MTWACKRATEEQIDKAEQLCDEIEKLYNQGVDHIYKDIEFHCFLAFLFLLLYILYIAILLQKWGEIAFVLFRVQRYLNIVK